MADIKKEFDAFLAEIESASVGTKNEIKAARKLLNTVRIQIERPEKSIETAKQEIADMVVFFFNNHPELLTAANATAAKKLAKRIGYQGPGMQMDETNKPWLKR